MPILCAASLMGRNSRWQQASSPSTNRSRSGDRPFAMAISRAMLFFDRPWVVRRCRMQFHRYTYAPISNPLVSWRPRCASISRVVLLELAATIPSIVPARHHPIYVASSPSAPSHASGSNAIALVRAFSALFVSSTGGSIVPITSGCDITCRIVPCDTNVWLCCLVATYPIGFMGSPRSPTFHDRDSLPCPSPQESFEERDSTRTVPVTCPFRHVFLHLWMGWTLEIRSLPLHHALAPVRQLAGGARVVMRWEEARGRM